MNRAENKAPADPSPSAVVCVRFHAPGAFSAGEKAGLLSARGRELLSACRALANAPEGLGKKDAAGRPAPEGAWTWSISHKETCAAAMAAPWPAGVDVERTGYAPSERLMARVADRGEWELLGGKGPEAFLRAWTAKEAALKSRGLGLSALSRCRVVEAWGEGMILEVSGERVEVVHREFAGHLVCATAGKTPIRWEVCG
ncbi:MAG: 4'-phosphopantetheinyl transferase superfamily protein [Deltaproteobacteria bacterium]|nr:4'-phosphopantetheinyl transferase superfamily protein [Deltaproteobacteria bacterium]